MAHDMRHSLVNCGTSSPPSFMQLICFATEFLPLSRCLKPSILIGSATTILAFCPQSDALAAPAHDKNSSSYNLTVKAYNQLRKNNFDNATATLCGAIKSNPDNFAARRYLSYALLREGYPEQALAQLQLMRTPAAFDLVMQGVASEMVGEPAKAAELYKSALAKEPKNDFYRQKAISAYITLSQYAQAELISFGGAKTAANPKARKFFADQQRRLQMLALMTSKNRPCTGPIMPNELIESNGSPGSGTFAPGK